MRLDEVLGWAVVGLVWLVTSSLAVGQPAALRNGGFEEGLAGWEVVAAPDFATITVEDDVAAPEGGKVLHISHQRTRSSSVTLRAQLEPWSYYLVSMDVRVAPYLRAGMGLLMHPWGWRYPEETLREEWQTLRLPLATGADGVVPINVAVASAAGEIWMDNLIAMKCSREDLMRVLGSDTPMGIPVLGLREPNTAEASVWNDEMPVSTRLPSQIMFSLRQNLADDAWAKTGRLRLELPAGVLVKRAGAALPAEEAGNRRICTITGFTDSRIELSLPQPLGDDRAARFWAEWDGGRQQPVEMTLTEINVPAVQAPKQLVTGTTVYGETLVAYAGYPDVIRSLGFNHLESWTSGISAAQMRDLGVSVSEIGPCPGEYTRLLAEDPDAKSTSLRGERVDMVCLSSRGKIHQQFLEDIATRAKLGQGAAGFTFDDESYVDWGGMDLCFCDRCKAAWADWLTKNHPELRPLDPALAVDDPLAHPDHYRAWWVFRASQLTNWYRDMRDTFRATTDKLRPAGSTPPRLVMQGASPEFDSIKWSRLDPKQLAEIFDLIAPMFYGDGDLVGRRTRLLVSAIGREKSCPTLCMGERYHWKPGEFRAQILETVFAGARGYTSWGWPYANLRIVAEAAEANGVLAANEDVLWKGAATDAFWTEQDGCRVAVRETDRAGLLLVSNYGNQSAVVVQRRPGVAVSLTEAFTGKSVRLSPGASDFAVAVQPGTCALWKWEK